MLGGEALPAALHDLVQPIEPGASPAPSHKLIDHHRVVLGFVAAWTEETDPIALPSYIGEGGDSAIAHTGMFLV